jgi:hypothetical protein
MGARRILLLLIVLTAAGRLGPIGPASADHNPLLPPDCTAEMVDIRLLPPAETDVNEAAHQLAIELSNRSGASCTLSPLEVVSPRMQGSGPHEALVSGGSEPDAMILAANETVHFTVAWSSIPPQYGQVTVDDCVLQDTLAFAPRDSRNENPWLELRHLEMMSCGSYQKTPYRPGPFTAGEAADPAWAARYRLLPDVIPGPVLPLTEAPGETAATAVHTLDPVQYLTGSAGSGYDGRIGLIFDATALANPNCPFRTLALREADGSTKIYLRRCDVPPPPKEGQAADPNCPVESRNLPAGEGKTTLLLFRHCMDPFQNGKPAEGRYLLEAAHLGMNPERGGEVEYEVAGLVTQHGSRVLATARLGLSIRGPKDPMLPPIDSNTPNCQASQLSAGLPIELPAYRSEPGDRPLPGLVGEKGKVYDVTNTSEQNCLLGGVPALKFFTQAQRGAIPTLPVCRNCRTHLFEPRESAWIDLAPHQSAHIIVVLPVLEGKDAGFCQAVSQLALLLPDDQQTLRLPFDDKICIARPSVSAWRIGRYDDDPMNRHNTSALAEPRRDAQVPVSGRCAKDASADTGQPVMFPGHGSVRRGLSTRPARYGERLPVLLWFDNSGDVPTSESSCGIDWFWSTGIAVFDSRGHRVLSRVEEEDRKTDRKPERLMSCTRNVPIEVPKQSCLHTSFSEPDHDLSVDLSKLYELPPGRYFVVPVEPRSESTERKDTPVAPQDGLIVTVEER